MTLPPIEPVSDEELQERGTIYHGGSYPMDIVSAYPLVYIVWTWHEVPRRSYAQLFMTTTDREEAQRVAANLKGFVTGTPIVFDAREES